MNVINFYSFHDRFFLINFSIYNNKDNKNGKKKKRCDFLVFQNINVKLLIENNQQ